MAKPKKILVVDDSMTFMAYITLLLRKMGFTKIVHAENGIEALKILKLWSPDAIILDLNMPEMDGISTLKSLKRGPQTVNIPVIMVATKASKKKYQQCEELGCAAFMTKPIKISVLHDVLQDCMNKADGTRRWYLRAPYRKKVQLKYRKKVLEAQASSLSEGGIFLKTDDLLPLGSTVEVTVPLNQDIPLKLKAKVIYHNVPEGKKTPQPQGMALKFSALKKDISETLRIYVTGLIIG
jgi:CheY-like chemotaxis protein